MAALASQYDNFDAKGFVFPRIVNSVEGGYVETAFAPAETVAATTTMTGAEALAAEKRTGAGVQDPATTIKSKVTVVENGNNVEVTTYMDGRVSKKYWGNQHSQTPHQVPSLKITVVTLQQIKKRMLMHN